MSTSDEEAKVATLHDSYSHKTVTVAENKKVANTYQHTRETKDLDFQPRGRKWKQWLSIFGIADGSESTVSLRQ